MTLTDTRDDIYRKKLHALQKEIAELRQGDALREAPATPLARSLMGLHTTPPRPEHGEQKGYPLQAAVADPYQASPALSRVHIHGGPALPPVGGLTEGQHLHQSLMTKEVLGSNDAERGLMDELGGGGASRPSPARPRLGTAGNRVPVKQANRVPPPKLGPKPSSFGDKLDARRQEMTQDLAAAKDIPVPANIILDDDSPSSLEMATGPQLTTME